MTTPVPSKELDFDADLDRLDQVRLMHKALRIELVKPDHGNGALQNVHNDRGFLLEFVDRLWGEYMRALDRADSTHEPCALRDALDAIASPSRPEDYGWWTQVARRALGVATANEIATPPQGAVNVAPIAKLTVRDGLVQRAGLYAPGLPDGEHDVFPVPLNPSGELQPSVFAQPPGAGWISVRDRKPEGKEPVVYTRPSRHHYGMWSVGIAYWTVSKKWNPECESTCAPEGFTHWMSLPDSPPTKEPAPSFDMLAEIRKRLGDPRVGATGRAYTGLCRAHQFGEDPSCMTCYPSQGEGVSYE